MAMIKTVSPSGWNWDRPVSVPIKLSSRGLIGNDRRDFLKQASHLFLPQLEQLKLAHDLEPVHSLALGASEAYGMNRNGDGFKEATCRACHPTFVKFARAYRNHRNKAPDNPYYGVVKLSAYNEDMRRVELLTAYFKTKEAAERHGGAGIADEELEKLAKGEDISQSMACRVPHDICMSCGNKARTRAEYCTASTCKAGGCKDNLARVVKIGRDAIHVGVDNPDPVWFDFSKVWRPADRIAYGARADYFSKAAADGGFFGVDGAKTAEDLGLSAPLDVILYQDGLTNSGDAGLLIKLAYGLAALERSNRLGGESLRAFSRDVQPALDLTEIAGSKRTKVAEALTALADARVILPLREFAQLEKQAQAADAAARLLPGIYDRMVSDGSIERHACASRYEMVRHVPPVSTRAWAQKVAETHSLDDSAVDTRRIRSIFRGHSVPDSISRNGMSKEAADVPGAADLANRYAVYKLAALIRIAESVQDLELTAANSLNQNLVN